MPVEELFFEIGTILVLAAFFSLVVFRFRQPLILGYIITGIVAGPGVLALTHNTEVFEVMSQIGVAFLLFTVGLGLNWRSLKEVGGISLATGVGQVLFTTVIGMVIGLGLGFNLVSSVYLAVAFSFSSTIIIVKLLMDKEEIDTLYGRISVGFLLVQDFIAMLLLLGIASLTGGATPEQAFASVVLKALILVPILWLVSAKLIPRLLSYVARSQEMLFIFSVAWCFLVAGILVMFGFGMEIGALIAGIALSSSVYQREISARVRPLRDFFLIIFFIVLGTRLGFEHASVLLIPTIIFSLSILIGHPLIVLLIMRGLGYHPRTGFLAGTTVAQISEFSFILIATGIMAGHINSELLTLSTSVGLITIAVSSYLIYDNERIYRALGPLLRLLEPKRSLAIEHQKLPTRAKVLLFGYHPIGEVLIEAIHSLKLSYLIVDFDPTVIRLLSEAGEPHLYGDVGDELLLEQIEAHNADMIISTIPDVVVSSSLLVYLKSKKYRGVTVVSVHTQAEACVCYELGADYVIVPNVLSGKKFSELLSDHRVHKRAWHGARKATTA
ncbi:cation:proton antiporter [Candidatus Uhrbacteria bacterium]|nr:cation:proton antiporter [Candidatus Uhrbacteria bacterium]